MSNPYLNEKKSMLEYTRRRLKQQAELIVKGAELQSARTIMGYVRIMQEHIIEIAELHVEIRMMEEQEKKL